MEGHATSVANIQVGRTPRASREYSAPTGGAQLDSSCGLVLLIFSFPDFALKSKADHMLLFFRFLMCAGANDVIDEIGFLAF